MNSPPSELSAPAVAIRPARLRPLRAMVAVLGLGLLGVLIPLTEEPFLYTIVLVMGFSVAAPIFFQWRRGTLDPYEPIHVLGILYFVYFGLGSIWTVNNPSDVAYDIHIPPHVPIAAFYCLLGMLALQAGYWLVLPRTRIDAPTEKVPGQILFLLFPVFAGFAGHLAAAAMEKGTTLPGIGGVGTSSLSQLSPLFAFAWALSWLLVLSRRASRAVRWTLFALEIPMTGIIAVLLLNDKSLLLILAATPMVALWYTRRVIPWISVTSLLLVLVFVIFPFNNLYRQLDERLPISVRLQRTVKTVSNWSGQEYWKRSVLSVQERFSLVNSMAIVHRDVPRFVPYAKGETLFLPTLVYFVPRVFWPDKPVYTFGRDFGQRFRVVNYLSRETSIAATVPGELYWNYDVPGIIVGMLLWGIAMRALYRRFAGTRNLDPIYRAIQILLLIHFVHWAGGIAGDVIVLVRTLLLLWGFLIVADRLKLTRQVPAVPMPTSR